MYICHCRKGSGRAGVGTDSLLCSFISPNTHFLPESSPRTFTLRCVTAASFSSPGPAPRLQPPCSVCPLHLPACCMHVQHGLLLHHCKVLQGPWAVLACVMCCPWPPCSPHVESTSAFLAVCANVEQGDRHTLILSTELGELISGMFYLRIAISGVCLFYLLPTSTASSTVFFYC